jgi:hypothetical protein
MIPSMRRVLKGYARFNRWEFDERCRDLPRLTVAEGLTQFFELCDLAHALTPDAERIFLRQDKAHWIARRKKFQRAAKLMRNERTTRRVA